MRLTDYKIDRKLMQEWMLTIFQLSGGISDFESAITVAKMVASNEEEKQIANTIANLYRAECSGQLNSEFKLAQYYARMLEI